MKILHVLASFVPAYRYGGPVRVLHEMCRSLVRLGQDVTVYTTNIDGPDDLDVPTGKEIDVDGVRTTYFRVRPPRSYSYSPDLGKAIKSAVKNFDVVHIHSVFNWPSHAAMHWARKRGVPYIVRPAGMLEDFSLRQPYMGGLSPIKQYLKKKAYLYSIERKNIASARFIHFTCEAEERNSFVSTAHNDRFIAPLGIDIKVVSGYLESASRKTDTGDKKIVLYVSRLDPKKGLDALIPAISMLSGLRKDFIFIIVGSGAPDYERHVIRLIHRYGIKDITLRTGLLGDERWGYFKYADVFVLPSYSENFGISVIEAMAAGLPAVVGEGVGIASEIKKAGAGIVTKTNPAHICSAINSLLGNHEMRQTMSRNAARLAAEKFSWDSVIKTLISKYEEALRC